jgi:predicted lipid-binding transport protein (Tim44 family)
MIRLRKYLVGESQMKKKNNFLRLCLVSVAFLFFLGYVLEIDSLARVGGGGSSGSRGSRSYSAPSRSAPSSPAAPSKSYQQPSAPAQPAGGGFFRSMAGGIMGGLLGGMLFSSLGHALGMGGGMGGGGIGLFEILLLAFILYMVYRFVKKRRQEAAAGASYYQSTPHQEPSFQQQGSNPGYDAPAGAPNTGTDTESGLRYIRQMDPYFDEARFGDTCMDTFFKIQGAWANRDMSTVRNLLTEEMYRNVQNDADRLKQDRKINRLDNIAVRSTDITEAWQESGKDYITVRFYANLLDYTVDESSGQVVSGSKTDPVKFEEYWTFVRPVGSNPWQLSAITQPQ